MKQFYLFCGRRVFNFLLGTVKDEHPAALHDVYSIFSLCSDELKEVVAYLPINVQDEINKPTGKCSELSDYVILNRLYDLGYNNAAVIRLHEWIVYSKSNNKGFE